MCSKHVVGARAFIIHFSDVVEEEKKRERGKKGKKNIYLNGVESTIWLVFRLLGRLFPAGSDIDRVRWIGFNVTRMPDCVKGRLSPV